MKAEQVLMGLIKQAEDAAAFRRGVIDQIGKQVIEAANLMSGVIGAGGKILVAGNGGSASMASHFVTELIVRLTSERNRQSLPAISLASDTGVITAAGNDFGFENIFSRQVEGLGNKGDLLFLMSTSGNSENLMRAAHTAKQKKVLTAALLGQDGGKLAPMVDRAIIIPHQSTQRIQEEHLFLIHQMVEIIESDLFA
jgi:D-sedoheptulose 7-phosphate isomerase